MRHWLETNCHLNAICAIDLLYGGIGVRQFYRVRTDKQAFVLMHSPDPEDVLTYKNKADKLRVFGLNVPFVFFEEPAQGFLLMEDFGDTSLLSALTTQNANSLYGAALTSLCQLQSQPLAGFLPFDWALYEKKLMRALNYIPIERQDIWRKQIAQLLKEVQTQPSSLCHRDFHTLNLMRYQNNIGILDFQDTSQGPLTYDLASLLQDCYIDWPRDRINAWVTEYFKKLLDLGIISGLALSDYKRWFDLTALLRHLRCYALFAGREQKDHQLPYAACKQRVVRYIQHACTNYPEYGELQL